MADEITVTCLSADDSEQRERGTARGDGLQPEAPRHKEGVESGNDFNGDHGGFLLSDWYQYN